MLCLQATFKSDYMALVTAAGTAMTELLCTKQTLSEVRSQGLAQTPLHVPACHCLCCATLSLVLLCHGLLCYSVLQGRSKQLHMAG